MISVILPTYNRAKWLSQSIESIIAQDYKDWELIVVDDASSDNTGEIVKEFMKKTIEYGMYVIFTIRNCRRL